MKPEPGYYEDLREKWKHEDNLINQRVTWLLNSQVFLFAAYGILARSRIEYDALSTIKNLPHFWRAFSPYSAAECIVTICSLAVVLFLKRGIHAALDAMSALKDLLHTHQGTARILLEFRIDVLDETTKEGANPARVLASVFVWSWLSIGTYEFSRVALPFVIPTLPIK